MMSVYGDVELCVRLRLEIAISHSDVILTIDIILYSSFSLPRLGLSGTVYMFQPTPHIRQLVRCHNNARQLLLCVKYKQEFTYRRDEHSAPDRLIASLCLPIYASCSRYFKRDVTSAANQFAQGEHRGTSAVSS